MKFKLIDGGKPFEAYGYRFYVGDIPDVKEPSLISKFEKYPQLEKLKPGPKPKNERRRVIKKDSDV